MNKKLGPQIVFVRHAHRDKPIPDADNGLSEKGLRQVDDLVKSYRKDALPKSSHFWTSPKKRCLQTLTPVCAEAQGQLKVLDLLNEQHAGESQAKFQSRIHDLIEAAEKLNETVYLCSHGDLIPEAIDFLCGKSVGISKGQALILEKQSGKWTLL